MASDAMALSDADGMVLDANPAYLKLYGYTAAEVIGHSFAIIFPAEVRAWAEAEYRRYFESDDIPPPVESSIVRADGAQRTVESSVAYLEEDGRRTAMLSIIRDITERKLVEGALREAHALARQALEEEIASRRQLEQALERSREEERARLARELHDGLGGALTALKMDLSRLRQRLAGERPEWDEPLRALLDHVDDTVHVMRRIASDLRPAMLDDLGLASAIAWQVDEFCRRSGAECRLITNAEDLELDPERSIALYRIVQEGLTNILRHAQATQAEVRLLQAPEGLRLEVWDNGCGIPPERLANGQTLGLAGMRERVRLLGGRLDISSAPGQGTTLSVVLPAQA